MNSLYGQSIGKDIDEENDIRSENWLIGNNDDWDIEYEPLRIGEDVLKKRTGSGNDKIKEVEKSMPSHLDTFVVSYNKRIMNKFVQEIDGFCSNKVYYQVTDSSYFNMAHYENLKAAGFVCNNLGH